MSKIRQLAVMAVVATACGGSQTSVVTTTTDASTTTSSPVTTTQSLPPSSTTTTTQATTTTTTTLAVPTEGPCPGDGQDISEVLDQYTADVDGDGFADSVMYVPGGVAVELAYGASYRLQVDWRPYELEPPGNPVTPFTQGGAGPFPPHPTRMVDPLVHLDLNGDGASEIVVFTADSVPDALIRYAGFVTFQDCELHHAFYEGLPAWLLWSRSEETGGRFDTDSHVVCRGDQILHIEATPTEETREATIDTYVLNGTKLERVSTETGTYTLSDLYGPPMPEEGTDFVQDPVFLELQCGSFRWGDM